MTLLPEDMASASYSKQTKLYTVTDSTGQTFQMTEESFDEFISKMDTTISDLGLFRDKLMQGTVVSVRENWNNDYLSMAAFQDVDAVNLQLGTFDDAVELQEAYRTVYYPTRAEQLDRVYHGLDTGRVVSQDIKTSYLENDGNVSDDLGTVQNEFNNNGGITQTDVEDVRSENDGNAGTDGEATEEGEEEPPML
ncbi:hypothetical protein [Glycomyces paridis]|uniref:Uncharacterized protein n=1 Tax=Glycomyces paridis TaxID=2126555 RepID=A0A4S8NWN2_9ACTN|nr:hypothetical protein [Glycomyces paridis]THV22037.1 hypothetical protein E9998_23745 [Glycomyces paridis]